MAIDFKKLAAGFDSPALPQAGTGGAFDESAIASELGLSEAAGTSGPSTGPTSQAPDEDAIAAELGLSSGSPSQGAGFDAQKEMLAAMKNPNLSPQQKKTVLGFLGNVISSGANAVKGVVDIVAHPIRTVKAAGSIALGGVEKLIPGQQKSEAAFDQLTGFYKDRYGSVDKFLETLYNDPVGAALDIATVLEGGGAAVAKVAGAVGKGSTAARIVSGANRVAEAGRALNPVTAATKVFGSAIGKAGAPFAGSADDAAINAAKRLGVDAPTSALTKSAAVQNAEALASKGFLGGKLTAKAEAAANDLGLKATQIADSIAPGASADGFLVRAGDAIKQGFDDYVEAFEKAKDGLYDDVLPKVRKVPVRYDQSIAALDDILGRREVSALKPGAVKELRQLRDSLASAQADGVNTFEAAKATRTDVGSKFKTKDPAVSGGDRAEFQKVYGALSNDMDAALKRFDPEAEAAFTKANDFYREGITRVNSKVGKAMANADPSVIVDKVLQPKNIENAKLAKSLAGDQAEMLQAAFLKRIVDKAMKDGKVSGAALAKEIAHWSPDVVKEMIGPDAWAKLSDVQTLADSIARGRKAAVGSQTAFLGAGAASLGIGLTNPALLIKILLGEAAAQKVLTSAWGRKWLTTGSEAAAKARTAVRAKAGDVGRAAKYGRALEASQTERQR